MRKNKIIGKGRSRHSSNQFREKSNTEAELNSRRKMLAHEPLIIKNRIEGEAQSQQSRISSENDEVLSLGESSS